MTTAVADRSGAGLPIAVVGGGSIGVAFAVVFARAGFRVRVAEPDTVRRAGIAERLHATLSDLHSFGLLERPVEELAARVTTMGSMAEAIVDAAYVQECAPEDRQLKASLFAEMDRHAPPETILASSSSAMPASAFASELPGRGRCLVVHPGNPPFLLRVAEVIPAPFTDPAAVARAQELLSGAGLATVLVRKEIKGFIFNRLQGAVLREAYCLVRDGVGTVEDIDTIVREGLGPRWSIVGPFETVDLNTAGGIARHAERLGPAYAEMGAERGQHDPWTPELVAEVEAQRRKALPLSNWEKRVRWRDRALMKLISCRRGTSSD